jgi:aminobenzoyl-glutamate transport protein
MERASSRAQRALDALERLGNRLPDPAALFAILLLATLALSAILAGVDFEPIDPRSQAPIEVHSQLDGPALASFLAGMVKAFTDFPPLGMVLVALLGVGVAEHVGFVGALLRAMLELTPHRLLTPAVIFVGCLGHVASDAGYVLLIPLAGALFAAAGRHPVVGICAAFAGVAGGLSCNPLPCALDPLLQGFTLEAARMLDPAADVNPLCNWYFTASSTLLIVLLGWWVTDRVVEPRLGRLALDGQAPAGALERLRGREQRALAAALAVLALGVAALVLAAAPAGSPLRHDGSLTHRDAPLMRAIVPLIFLFFLLPGVAYGIVAGTVRSHRDVIQGMSRAMGTMSYYLVLAFAAALFTEAFSRSNLGALLALEGGAALRELDLAPEVTVLAVLFFSGLVDLVVASASAKWALLAPIFVPMLMQGGIAPELTQAAFRIGDSVTNVVTPLNPYFPLVVVYCQKHARATGIGTLAAAMAPYALVFGVCWSAYLLGYWTLDLPLGVGARYAYP